MISTKHDDLFAYLSLREDALIGIRMSLNHLAPLSLVPENN